MEDLHHATEPDEDQTHPLHAAYVRAWVWVELPTRAEPYTDEEIVEYAQEHYQRDGEIEFESDAVVSRGDEDCDCDDEVDEPGLFDDEGEDV